MNGSLCNLSVDEVKNHFIDTVDPDIPDASGPSTSEISYGVFSSDVKLLAALYKNMSNSIENYEISIFFIKLTLPYISRLLICHINSI